jgi:hypothetical protein
MKQPPVPKVATAPQHGPPVRQLAAPEIVNDRSPETPAASGFESDLTRIPIRGAAALPPIVNRSAPMLRPKLKVNTPDDRFEEEADRVADLVLRMPAPATAARPTLTPGAFGLRRKCVCGKNSIAGGECDECARKRLQRKEAPGISTASPITAPPSVDRALARRGAPLPPALQQDMSDRFGHDFSRVRVHSDEAAQQSARDVNALAYTVGQNIVFGTGQFAPTTAEGRRLLAHELVHTLQNEPHVARQSAPPKCITGKQEGAGQTIKSTVLFGKTYSYLVWGQWQETDSVEAFRSRVLSKWVTWRFKGISAAERQAVIAFLQGSRFLPFDTSALERDCYYSLPLEDAVVKQARALSGEAAREKAAAEDKGGGSADANDSVKQSPGAVAAPAEKRDKDKTPGDPSGEKDIAITSNPGVFDGNAPLAQVYLNFLARYAGMKTDVKQAEKGLTREQVTAITKGNPRAATVTGLFTQGWSEYRKAGGADIATFGFMEEALLTQRDRGNFTALHNQLEFDKDPEGLGLYKRGTPFRYYDASGMPIATTVGGYRDPGFRAAAPSPHALQISTTDRGLTQVFQAIKNVTLDDPILIYQSAKGYYDNGDLLYPAVIDGWDGWKQVNEELRAQLPALVVFMALEALSAGLQRMQDPKAKAAGAALQELLRAGGKIFKLQLVGHLAVLAFDCGLELSKIQREEGSKQLDALSDQHLKRAALHMRQLLAELLALALLATILKTAKETAITIGDAAAKGSPPGGGLVPAPAGAGGRAPQSGLRAIPVPPPFVRPSPPNLQSLGGGTPESSKEAEKPKEAEKVPEQPKEPEKPITTELTEAQKQQRLSEIAGEKAKLQAQIEELTKKIEAADERVKEAEKKMAELTQADSQRAEEVAKQQRNAATRDRLTDDRTRLIRRANELNAERERLLRGPHPISPEDAENRLREETGGQKKTIKVNDELGERDIDCFTPDGKALEAKYGEQKLDSFIEKQIAKDVELRRSKKVTAVEWHFYRNPKTGAGPDARMREALRIARIPIILHY